MRRRTWLFACLVFTALATTAERVVATDTQAQSENHVYQIFVDANATWTEAQAHASALGGHLVTITSQDEQTLVENLLLAAGAPTGGYWVGLIESPSEGNYQWVNGEPLSFTHWVPGQPDNAGGQFGGESRGQILWTFAANADTFARRGQWNDIRQEGWSPHPFACPCSDLNRAGYVVEIDVITLNVAIDIKPGSFPNSINLSSAGVVPVAILGTSDFNANEVDPATVTLAGAQVKMIGKGDRYACRAEDVNGDSLLDMLCQVYTVQFLIEPGDSLAVFEAQTLSGQKIRGQDSIRIVPQ